MVTPIILDCDTGTDDALAILLALASPELDIRAITVAGGNVGLDRTLANTLALTRLAQSNVPVHGGADRPLLGAFVNEPRVHGADGLGGIVLPDGGQPAPELAADAIRRILRRARAGDTRRHRTGDEFGTGGNDGARFGRQNRPNRSDERRLG